MSFWTTFFSFSFLMQLIYFGQKPNKITIFLVFLYAAKSRRRRNWIKMSFRHEVCIILYQSLAPLIRLYPSEIFVSYCFRKNSLVSNFFFSLILQHIKKKNSYFIWFLSKIYQLHQKKRKKVVQKDIYWFLPQKTKQGKVTHYNIYAFFTILKNLWKIFVFLTWEGHPL